MNNTYNQFMVWLQGCIGIFLTYKSAILGNGYEGCRSEKIWYCVIVGLFSSIIVITTASLLVEHEDTIVKEYNDE